MRRKFVLEDDQVLWKQRLNVTNTLVILGVLLTAVLVRAQPGKKDVSILTINSAIETVLPLSGGCLLVAGSLSFGGDNFIVKKCSRFLEMKNIGHFGYFGKLQKLPKNKILGIVGGSLVSVELNHDTLNLKVIKEKSERLFLTDLIFADEKRGWACGENGLILATKDGGDTWNETAKATDINLFQVRTSDGSWIWSLGRENRQSAYLGVFLTSSDGGITWNRKPLPNDGSFEAASFRAGLIGCGIAGPNKLLCTNDGLKWRPVLVDDKNLSDILFLDREIGFVVGDTISKTSDGGKMWRSKLPSNMSFSMLSKIIFVNHRVGYAWGLRTVLETKDGGDTWRNISSRWFRMIKSGS